VSTYAFAEDAVAPDGTVLRGLAGAQRPRLTCSPPRHILKDPYCKACDAESRPFGCGNSQSADLLEWSATIGYDMDDWQEWSLTEGCGTRPDGTWSAFEVLLIAPRQNGKNGTLEVRELGGLYILGERVLIHTAHEFKAAIEHFRRVRDTIDNYDGLRRRVKSVTTSHGDEAIELRPVPTLIFGSGGKRVRRSVGARLRFLARSRGSGRSFTADFVAYDEGMFLSEDMVGASMPTMSAVPNPQMWYTASAGYKDSTQLAMVRRRMIKGGDPSLFGAEWSINAHTDQCPRDEARGRRSNRFIVCTRHDDRDDPRSWAKANPALGTRISVRHVAQELTAMPADTFDRERNGVGDWPEEDETWSAVTQAQWDACAMADPGGATRPVCFAVDVAEDMKSACIAAAWEKPRAWAAVNSVDQQLDTKFRALTFRTVIEIPKGCSREGTDWVIPRLIELRRAWRPLGTCFPASGKAAALIDDALNAGLDVTKAGTADEAAAYALMVTGIRDGKIIHLGREQAPELWSAMASAETRDVGDGGTAWSRRDSGASIAPVTAGTLAYWLLNKKRRNYDPLKSIG
jgi:hypothetical protein